MCEYSYIWCTYLLLSSDTNIRRRWQIYKCWFSCILPWSLTRICADVWRRRNEWRRRELRIWQFFYTTEHNVKSADFTAEQSFSLVKETSSINEGEQNCSVENIYIVKVTNPSYES